MKINHKDELARDSVVKGYLTTALQKLMIKDCDYFLDMAAPILKI